MLHIPIFLVGDGVEKLEGESETQQDAHTQAKMRPRAGEKSCLPPLRLQPQSIIKHMLSIRKC